MKTLYLMRHAAAVGNSSSPDYDRPLSDAGHFEAEQMAARLGVLEPRPSLVLCSSAVRTRETLAAIEKRLPSDTQILTSRYLYLASGDSLMARIAHSDDAHAAILVVAHFPGIAELANALTRSGNTEARSLMARTCPPASLAVLSVEISEWSELREKTAELREFSSPEDLD